MNFQTEKHFSIDLNLSLRGFPEKQSAVQKQIKCISNNFYIVGSILQTFVRFLNDCKTIEYL